jgi:hypothetical protein
MEVIPEMYRVHLIWYLRFYYIQHEIECCTCIRYFKSIWYGNLVYYLINFHLECLYNMGVDKCNVFWQQWYLMLKLLCLPLSKVKVPRRSLRYTTHHLMVMHPHTKYNWPIWKDKKVMVWTNFVEKKQKRKKKSD